MGSCLRGTLTTPTAALPVIRESLMAISSTCINTSVPVEVSSSFDFFSSFSLEHDLVLLQQDLQDNESAEGHAEQGACPMFCSCHRVTVH